MRSILFLLFAIFICNSLPTPLQCDSANREYVCLVLNECVIGNTLPPIHLVEFNPRTDQLKKENCDVLIQISREIDRPSPSISACRNLNDRQWFINITVGVIYNAFFLKQDADNILAYNAVFGSSEILTAKESCAKNSVHRICNYTIEVPSTSTDRNLANFLITRIRENFNIKFTYTYNTAVLRKESVFYCGCDHSLITVHSATVSEGTSLNVSARLMGRNAAIDCKEKRADRLYIKRATDTGFVEVSKVFCPEDVWAVENSDGKVEYLGEETFDLKCIRNYCKYCGRIYEQSCDSCEDIEYEDCTPKCPRNLWLRSGTIINSPIKCMANKESDDFGEWNLMSNGVDVPFLAGSCYTGPYPLREEHKVISNFSPSFSFRAILLVLLPVFKWTGIC